MNTKIQGPQDLPPELTELIFRELPTSDLLSVLRTCWPLKKIAERVLYASVTIRSSEGIQSFRLALSANSDLATLVRSYTFEDTLELGYPYVPSEDSEEVVRQQVEGDIHILNLLPRLEHLRCWKFSKNKFSELRRQILRPLNFRIHGEWG